MSDELVFTVSDAKAKPAKQITLAEAGLKERDHLQEWVLAHPQILGEGVRPVTFEFEGWENYAGTRDQHRLDVLGLDRDGMLVVAELKRGKADSAADLQAVQYAAMASRFTVETLAAHHAKFLTKTSTDGEHHTPDDALEALQEHAPDLSDDTLKTPQVVLIANEFADNVSSTIVFLNEVGLKCSIVRFQAYETGTGETVVTFSRLYPVPEVEEFVLTPRTPEQREKVRQRSRRPPAVSRIIDAGALAPGTTLRFDPNNETNAETREKLEAWAGANPGKTVVTWQEQPRSAPLVWKYDGDSYSPTALALTIIEEATGETLTATRGTEWWVDDDGSHLAAIADELTSTRE